MENTAERIVAKAYELFMRLGIRSVSMDEIATQLGMSKKTIYLYYADKDELVEDAIEIVLNMVKYQVSFIHLKFRSFADELEPSNF